MGGIYTHQLYLPHDAPFRCSTMLDRHALVGWYCSTRLNPKPVCVRTSVRTQSQFWIPKGRRLGWGLRSTAPTFGCSFQMIRMTENGKCIAVPWYPLLFIKSTLLVTHFKLHQPKGAFIYGKAVLRPALVNTQTSKKIAHQHIVICFS